MADVWSKVDELRDKAKARHNVSTEVTQSTTEAQQEHNPFAGLGSGGSDPILDAVNQIPTEPIQPEGRGAVMSAVHGVKDWLHGVPHSLAGGALDTAAANQELFGVLGGAVNPETKQYWEEAAKNTKALADEQHEQGAWGASFLAKMAGEGVASVPGFAATMLSHPEYGLLKGLAANPQIAAKVLPFINKNMSAGAQKAAQYLGEAGIYDAAFNTATGRNPTAADEATNLLGGLLIPGAFHLPEGAKYVGEQVSKWRNARDIRKNPAAVNFGEKSFANPEVSKVTFERAMGMENSNKIGDLHPAIQPHVNEFANSGFSITSTVRGHEHNKQKGRDRLSAHELKLGFDATPQGRSFDEAYGDAKAFADSIGYDVIHEYKGTPNEHFHFEPKGSWQIGKDGRVTLNGQDFFEVKRHPNEQPTYPHQRGPNEHDATANQTKTNSMFRTLVEGVPEGQRASINQMDAELQRLIEHDPEQAAVLINARNQKVDALNAEYQQLLKTGPGSTPATGGMAATPEARVPDVPPAPVQPGQMGIDFGSEAPLPPTQSGEQLPLPVGESGGGSMVPLRGGALEEAKLPAELKQEQMLVNGRPVSFASDVDRALYAVSKLRADEINSPKLLEKLNSYLSFLEQHFDDESPEQILAHARELEGQVDEFAKIQPEGKAIKFDATLNKGRLKKQPPGEDVNNSPAYRAEQEQARIQGMLTQINEARMAGKQETITINGQETTRPVAGDTRMTDRLVNGYKVGMTDADFVARMGLQGEQEFGMKLAKAFRDQEGIPDMFLANGTVNPAWQKWHNEARIETEVEPGTAKITFLGEESDWEDFITTDHFKEVTSEDFLKNSLGGMRLSPTEIKGLEAAQQVAHKEPLLFNAYIDMLEGRFLEHGVSLRLAPEKAKFTQVLAEALELAGVRRSKEFGYKGYVIQKDLLLTALSKYVGSQYRLKHMSDVELARFTRLLQDYTTKVKAGKLTKDEHQKVLDALQGVIKNFSVHSSSIPGSPGSAGAYWRKGRNGTSPADAAIDVLFNADLVTTAHELTHALTIGNQAFSGFFTDTIKLDAKSRLKIAYATGFHYNDVEYILSDAETSERLMQLYMTAPDWLKQNMPAEYALSKKHFDKLEPHMAQEVLIVQSLFDAGIQTQLHWQEYRNNNGANSPVRQFLSDRRDAVDYVKNPLPTTVAGYSKKPIATVNKKFNELQAFTYKDRLKAATSGWGNIDHTWLTVDGTYNYVASNVADALVKKDAQAWQTAMGGPQFSNLKSPDLEFEVFPEHDISHENAAVTVNTRMATNAVKWKAALSMPGKLFSSFTHGLGYHFDKFGGLNSRAEKTKWVNKVDENGNVQKVLAHANPHLNGANAARVDLLRQKGAMRTAYIDGEKGIRNHPIVQKYLPTMGDNVQGLISGKHEALDPVFNSKLRTLTEASKKRYKYLDQNDLKYFLDQDGSQEMKDAVELYPILAKYTGDMSSMMKKTLTQRIIKGHEVGKKWLGTEVTPEDILRQLPRNKENKALRTQLQTLVDSFMPGYFSQVRHGNFKVFVKEIGKKDFSEVIGAKGLREARILEKEMREKYGDNFNVHVEKKDLPFTFSDTLEEKSDSTLELLHALGMTDHGADITAADIAEMSKQLSDKGGIKAYRERRLDVKGYENQSVIEDFVTFEERVASYIHGLEYRDRVLDLKSKIPDWAKERLLEKHPDLEGRDFELDKRAREEWKRMQTELNYAYRNALAIPNEVEKVFEKVAELVRQQTGIEGIPHFREVSQFARTFSQVFTLGLGNLKPVALAVTHGLQIAYPELASHTAAMNKATGVNAPKWHAEQMGLQGMKKAFEVLTGIDKSSEYVKLWKKATEEGYLHAGEFNNKDNPFDISKEGLYGHKVGGTNAKGLLNKIQHVTEVLGRQSDRLRQMGTFFALVDSLKFYGMDIDQALPYAANLTRKSLDLDAGARPTMFFTSGEAGNSALQYKGFLWNALDKVIETWRMGKGEVLFEVPNPKYKPGGKEPKMIEVTPKDWRPFATMMAAGAAIGGVGGIPLLGLMIDTVDYATGDDWKLKIKQTIKNAGKAVGAPGLGELAGDLVDHGGASMVLGIPLHEFGSLMYPTPEKGLQDVLLPVSWQIMSDIVKRVKGAVEEAPTNKAMAWQVLQAVSPTFVRRMEQTAELAFNDWNLYDNDGSRITKVKTMGDVFRMLAGGEHSLKEDDFRMYQLDKNLQEKYHKDNRLSVIRVANNLLQNQPIDYVDLRKMQTTPGYESMLKQRLKKMVVPEKRRVLEQIANSKDGELALMRWKLYQAYTDGLLAED